MKPNIHPAYGNCIVICSCGNTFKTRATQPSIRVEVCGACHPFYTGAGHRLVDTMGRIDRFRRKYGQTAKPAPSA